MFERSKLSVVCARYQPRFSSPMMFCLGMRTSSKKTSLNSCVPAMLMSGRTVTPGAFISAMKYVIPRCFGASGSVRASRIIHFATWPPEVQIFWPFTT